MSYWNEASLSEDPAVELLTRLGYTYVAPEVLEAERASLKDVVLEGRLATALKRLNPWLSDSNVKRAIKAITGMQATSLTEAGENNHVTLTHGMSVEQDRGQGKTSHDVRFFDFHDPGNNDLVVTRQFKVLGSKKHIYPDVVLFINGLPLAAIECKSPTLGDKWLAEAVGQLRRYQEADSQFFGMGAPRLFETVQVVVACCREAALYGTLGTPQRYFFEWKTDYRLESSWTDAEHVARGPVTSFPRLAGSSGAPVGATPRARGAEAGWLFELLGHEPTPQDRLIAGLLAPAALLDVTRNFEVFDLENGQKVRKLCRYKQYEAVNRAVARIKTARKPTERGGVVWHTQGSGKSLTMLWLALKLRRDPALQNPTLVVVTDRTALDKQIADTFERCGFPNPQRADSVKELRALLRRPTGQAVMTTVQKFMELGGGGNGSKRVRSQPHPVLSESSNIFVLVDEAHRTQYRSLATNMRRALPKACFLGFTGTPIDKSDKSTLTTFGPYIDTYTIEQAVADQAIVPIKYEGRLPELRIIGQRLDDLFDRVFADRSDQERAAIKKKYANEQTLAGAPRRIEAICLDLIEHYTQAIAPNGFKAQIVAVNRDTAVTYKETLDRLHGPDSALIMSGGHNDPERLARWQLKKSDQDRLVDGFKNAATPQILIVVDMLLTGFDAPVEQVLYLDSPLREHSLLQAIARVNRKAEHKDYGLVVDYWGVSEALQEALAIFSPSDIAGALSPKIDELPRLQSRHHAALRFFAQVKDRDDLDACVAVLEPEDVRAEFGEAFKRLSQSLDMLLPDPRAGRYLDDVRWLGKILGAARARYRDGQLDISDCGAKVRALIEQAVIADGIRILVKEVSLFSTDFDDKLKALKTPEARASEMEHAIRHEIHVRLDENPAFYESLRERLQKLIDDRKAQRITAAQQLELMAALKAQVHGELNAAQDHGLSASAFAIYGLLGKTLDPVVADRGPEYGEQVKAVAANIDEVIEPLTNLVDWWQKDDVQREMRRAIKGRLRGTELVDEDQARTLAESIIDLAKNRRRS
ncbi:MAG: type I restriction endonuclease subunit R [Pseudomonadota bacterium]